MRGGDGRQAGSYDLKGCKMNREEIMQMEAGRELDALVAKKVMGWKYGQAGVDWSGWVGVNPRPSKEANLGHFSPSTNISAAWEVVEKLKENQYSLPQIYLTDSDNDWHVSVRVAGDQGFIDIQSPTTPLAICRAALLTTLSK
jgi:hypothetical protein